MKDYSQYGETKLIAEIVKLLEQSGFVVPRVAVEFGAGDGYHLSNIRGLMEAGWTGFQYDWEPKGLAVVLRNITVDNVNQVVPMACGVLSIDVDGNDYWLWRALLWAPCIVVIEFNPTLGGNKTIFYDPYHRWAGDDYFGASFGALVGLGTHKGYGLLYRTPCNLIFVRADLHPPPETVEVYEPIAEGWKLSGRAFQSLFLKPDPKIIEGWKNEKEN